MRPTKLITALALILGLAAGLVWCAGPCCATASRGVSSLWIGAASCCGAGTPSRCQPSVQNADAAALSSAAVAHSPLPFFTGPVAHHAVVTPDWSQSPGPAFLVPENGLSARHTPLLI